MTTPNHLTGGIVFTGLFCSFFSVNIFANPIFVSVTLIGSIIPDIDHTKSVIGKAFYPVAKYLSVNYGHRTITHSLLFLIGICTISVFIENNFREDFSISTILFFSVFSHLLFDMVTLQGIPLFYPFYKNPCVLPANPEMRIRSGNIRQEGVILFIFCFLTFFMQDLFKNGFWSTINNEFQDVSHQIREFHKSKNVLELEYDFDIYQQNFKGKGIILQVENDEIFILSKNELFSLKKAQEGLKINVLKSTKTNQFLHQNKIQIDQISEEEINEILKNKFITQAKIYTNFPTALKNNLLEINKKFDLKNKYNLNFKSSAQDTIFANKQKNLAELEMKLKNEENQLINENKSYYSILGELQKEKNKLKSNLSNFELNETQKKIIELENKIANSVPKSNLMIPEIKRQIGVLKKEKAEKIKYSGELVFIEMKN
jgi:membrane-bound metal-dependent hydrolase YbcI (DUF457 family)